ncbi:delta(24)-sterol reductase-like [Daphnia pulex]|uniref:delta(24)-sterol reductase-like n=1 Tax=Daphnia pulex TaxID=6669 RepID=UPI001EE13151|nr:delta(24)-sterol reductase-like [Daphnia pulex]XP_046464384.1 delta(24)-sterol reductase-like [Daphnia pulex]
MDTAAWKKKLVRLMEDNRGLIVLLFCLPASFLFDLVLQLRNWFNRTFLSAPQRHDTRVRQIQSQVRHCNDLPEAEKKLMCTSRPNWLSLSITFFRKDLCHKIPIPLYDILELKEEVMTVRVEPMVTVGDITRYLIPKGYTLAVTLEIADATLGGLAFGVGMTTYSHKVGLYQETIVAYEVVLGDGSLVRVTKDNEYSDLFYCLPWSHGTLGFLVALELQIIPVKPYVKMEYIPINGQKEYCDKIRELSGAMDKDKQTPDFVEATIFSKHEAVLMVGHFANVKNAQEEAQINHVARWYKPWFYKHVESFLNKPPSQEFIPLREYLLRHNRAIFWVVESMIPFGNNPLFRLLFGWLLPPKPAFLKFTTTPGIRAMTFTKQVFQDIVLPINVLEKQIDVAEEIFDAYPILVYPCRIYDHGPHTGQLRPPRSDQMCPGTNWGMFNDLGVYGVPGPVKRKERFDAVGAMRKMEKFTRDVGGYPFLYADIFMNRKEFEEMFDLVAYEKARAKYHANDAFPHLYDKVKPEIDVFQVGKEYMDPL